MTPINWFEVAAIFGGGVSVLTYFFYRQDQKAMRRSSDTFKVTQPTNPTEPSTHHLDIYRKGKELRSHVAFTGGEQRTILEHKASYEIGEHDMRTRFSCIDSMFETNDLTMFIAQDFASDLVRMYLELGRPSAGTSAEQRKAYYLGAVYTYKELLSESSEELRSILNRLVATEVSRCVKSDTKRAVANLTS